MLAPADVLFFDASWSSIGLKSSLTKTLSRFTGIDEGAFYHRRDLDWFSIAERMSWASSRPTSRIEDEAYCLMGLFEVNMRLIYAEGRRAFIRLQEELLEKSDDAFVLTDLAPADTLLSPFRLPCGCQCNAVSPMELPVSSN